MITTAILNLLYVVLTLVLSPFSALPDATLPTGITSGIANASSYLSILSIIVPVADLLIVLGSVLAIEGGIFTFKVIRWAYRKIPGIN
jgi:hypothetical protein